MPAVAGLICSGCGRGVTVAPGKDLPVYHKITLERDRIVAYRINKDTSLTQLRSWPRTPEGGAAAYQWCKKHKADLEVPGKPGLFQPINHREDLLRFM